jgi:hypothetical protein
VQLSAQEAGVQLLDGFHGSGHSIGLGGHGGFGLSGGGGDGGASGRQSPAAALGSRAVSRARCVGGCRSGKHARVSAAAPHSGVRELPKLSGCGRQA